jgi:hypothetical protein
MRCFSDLAPPTRNVSLPRWTCESGFVALCSVYHVKKMAKLPMITTDKATARRRRARSAWVKRRAGGPAGDMLLPSSVI